MAIVVPTPNKTLFLVDKALNHLNGLINRNVRIDRIDLYIPPTIFLNVSILLNPLWLLDFTEITMITILICSSIYSIIQAIFFYKSVKSNLYKNEQMNIMA